MIKYIVCNLKANKLKEEMEIYEGDLKNLPLYNDLKIIICPSAPFFYLFDRKNYFLGAQDISEFEEGAYTGEITGKQLSSMNIEYTLIGHSERRAIIKESDKTITNKIKRAYHHHIRPIYFIGETQEQRHNGNTEEVLTKQLKNVIDEVPDYKRPKMIVVYEPIWAIGTGHSPSKDEISKRLIFIKKMLYDNYNIEIPVLYGGSINNENISELIEIKELDGVVLGESCKDFEDLEKIIKKVKKI